MPLFDKALPMLAAFAVLYAGTALAEDFPILGDWSISNAVIGPWVTAEENKPAYEAAAKPRLKLMVTFRPEAVITKDPIIGCTEANYERTLFPPEALFQGGLPEPDQAQLARDLGFASGSVPGFDLSCSTGLFSYHFATRDILMFALDNMIYMLERKK